MNVNFNNSMNILDTSSKSRPREVAFKERDDAPLRKKADESSAFEKELRSEKRPVERREAKPEVKREIKDDDRPQTNEAAEKVTAKKQSTSNAADNEVSTEESKEAKNDNFTPEEKAKFEKRLEDRKAVKPLKTVVKAAGDISSKSPVLALLTGQLENINPQDIPSLVSSNRFISEAMGSEEITSFLEDERDIGELAEMLSIPAVLVHQAIDQGLNPLEKVTPDAFLKALNVDPGRVGSELSLLRDNVALEGLKGYMQRAEKLAGGAANTPSLTKEEVYTKLASQMGRAQNHNMVEQMARQAAQKQHPMMAAIAQLMNQQKAEAQQVEGSPRFVEIQQPSQASKENIGDGFSPIGLPGEELPSRFFAPKDKPTNYEAIMNSQLKGASSNGAQSNSLATSNGLAAPSTMGNKISDILAGANAIFKMNGSDAQKSINQPINMKQDMADLLSENKFRQDISLDQARNMGYGKTPTLPGMENIKPATSTTMTVDELIGLDDLSSSSLKGMASESADDFVAETSDIESFLGDRGSKMMFGGLSSNAGINGATSASGSGFKMALHETSSDNFRASLIDKAQAHIAAGSGKANFTLTTPELGQVNLSMSLEGDKLDLKMMSSSQQVRDMLAIEIPKLKEALQEQNIQLQDVNVGVDSESSSGFAQGQAGERQREIFEQFDMNRKNSNMASIAEPKANIKSAFNPMKAARASHHNGQFVAVA